MHEAPFLHGEDLHVVLSVTNKVNVLLSYWVCFNVLGKRLINSQTQFSNNKQMNAYNYKTIPLLYDKIAAV